MPTRIEHELSKREFQRHLQEWLDKLARFVAWHLVPYRVRYWIVIRAGADASTGEWSSQKVPDLTVMDTLKRMS
jgi:hypothetical protein